MKTDVPGVDGSNSDTQHKSPMVESDPYSDKGTLIIKSSSMTKSVTSVVPEMYPTGILHGGFDPEKSHYPSPYLRFGLSCNSVDRT